MDKFQECYEELQNSILDIFNVMTKILRSTTKTSDEKLDLLEQYVNEQYEIICTDIAIHNDIDE